MSTTTIAPKPAPPSRPNERRDPEVRGSEPNRSLMPVVAASATVLMVAGFIGLAISGNNTEAPTAILSSRAEATGPAAAIAEFSSAWSAGDWEAMRAIASESVVEAAQQYHLTGGSAGVVETSETGGELLYSGPVDGSALIFNYVIEVDDRGSAHITELTFAGDAG